MPRYRLNTRTFIAPTMYEEGTVIEYNGPPGPHMDPVDGAAQTATDKYYKDNPHASINPVDQLDSFVASPVSASPVQNMPSVGPVEKISDPDPEGVGSFAPTSDEPLTPEVGGGFVPRAEDPATGDPTKPGEKGSELKAKTDAANKAAEDAAKK